MKKFLIIFGVVLLLIIGAVWTYIFLYGAPQSVDDIFARFTTTEEREPSNVDTGSTVDVGYSDDPEEDVPRTRLSQLTTRPVAGAVLLDGAIRYVERGTGHIYEINLMTRQEKKISGVTRPRTTGAVFAPGGDHVALTAETQQGDVTVLATLANGSLDITALPEGAEEPYFSEAGDALHFFVPSTQGGSGYRYSLADQKTITDFTIPLRDVRVLWGAPTLILTKPSAYANGYLYRVENSGLSYITEGGSGLMATRHASSSIVSYKDADRWITRDTRTGTTYDTFVVFPEKCTVDRSTPYRVFCASPINLDEDGQYPDDWYKGITTFTDSLLYIDSTDGRVGVVSNLEDEAGRPIDIRAIGTDATGNRIHFINKYDGSLWLLDLTIPL